MMWSTSMCCACTCVEISRTLGQRHVSLVEVYLLPTFPWPSSQARKTIWFLVAPFFFSCPPVMSATWRHSSIPRLSNTLFASLVGPPLNEFSPLPYVKKWLLDHRAAVENQSKKVRSTDTANMRYGHMTSVFLLHPWVCVCVVHWKMNSQSCTYLLWLLNT